MITQSPVLSTSIEQICLDAYTHCLRQTTSSMKWRLHAPTMIMCYTVNAHALFSQRNTCSTNVFAPLTAIVCLNEWMRRHCNVNLQPKNIPIPFRGLPNGTKNLHKIVRVHITLLVNDWYDLPPPPITLPTFVLPPLLPDNGFNAIDLPPFSGYFSIPLHRRCWPIVSLLSTDFFRLFLALLLTNYFHRDRRLKRYTHILWTRTQKHTKNAECN